MASPRATRRARRRATLRALVQQATLQGVAAAVPVDNPGGALVRGFLTGASGATVPLTAHHTLLSLEMAGRMLGRMLQPDAGVHPPELLAAHEQLAELQARRPQALGAGPRVGVCPTPQQYGTVGDMASFVRAMVEHRNLEHVPFTPGGGSTVLKLSDELCYERWNRARDFSALDARQRALCQRACGLCPGLVFAAEGTMVEHMPVGDLAETLLWAAGFVPRYRTVSGPHENTAIWMFS